jgi:HEAT repeat protein
MKLGSVERIGMRNFRLWFLSAAVLLPVLLSARAQNETGNANNQAAQAQSAPDEPDQPAATHSANLKSDPSGALSTAWEMMEAASKASKPQEHISLLVALGTLGGYKQAEDMLTAAMKDSDIDIRLAAVASAGTSGDRALIPALRIAMEDQAPEVVVTAAASLWKMGDHTGMDVLQEVLTGQMKAKSGLLKSSMHTVNRDLHDPSLIATMGAEEGASMLFGPVGIAISAAKFAHPGPTANSPRVISASLLAEDLSESTKTALIQTLKDKDPFVRQASAKALAKFKGKDVTDALVDGFDDLKPSVRYMSAASYIRVTSPLAPVSRHRTRTAARRKPVPKQS